MLRELLPSQLPPIAVMLQVLQLRLFTQVETTTKLRSVAGQYWLP
jgi:hypothetical protein